MGKYFIRKAELGALLLSAGILFAGAISAMPKISLSVHVNNPQGAVDLRIESLRINLAGCDSAPRPACSVFRRQLLTLTTQSYGPGRMRQH